MAGIHSIMAVILGGALLRLGPLNLIAEQDTRKHRAKLNDGTKP